MTLLALNENETRNVNINYMLSYVTTIIYYILNNEIIDTHTKYSVRNKI